MAWTAPKTWTGGERLYASDLNTYVSDNLADLDSRVASGTLNYTPLAYISASESGGSITMDVDNGTNFSFSRSMSGNETVSAPSNMPEGSVVNFYVDATNTGTSAPVVEARLTGENNTATTSHTITLPSGIVAGELLLVIVSSDGAPSIFPSSGGAWVKAAQAAYSTTVTSAVFYKVAEGSDTLGLSFSASEKCSWISFRISGTMLPPSIVVDSANGSSTNGNPPSITLNDSENRGRLYIASLATDAQVIATAAPSNYTDLTTEQHAASDGASICTAERTTTGTTNAEDPGTFTNNSEQWVCFTIGIDSIGSHKLSYSGFTGSTPDVRGKALLNIARLDNDVYVVGQAWTD